MFMKKEGDICITFQLNPFDFRIFEQSISARILQQFLSVMKDFPAKTATMMRYMARFLASFLPKSWPLAY